MSSVAFKFVGHSTFLLSITACFYVAFPGSVILSTTKTGRHDIAESGVKHQNSNSSNNQ
jgi:hypothetical protein